MDILGFGWRISTKERLFGGHQTPAEYGRINLLSFSSLSCQSI